MTNMPAIFITGFVIGISIAAPVGPIGILCIRRTLANGRAAGFISGLGAATADMIYGMIAAFGLTAVTRALVDNAALLRIVGGFFLLYLGIKTFLEKPSDKPAQASQGGMLSMYTSTFLLTITNPMTILSFAAIFAGTLLGKTTGSPVVMVAGVFTGSAFWWLSLSFGVGILRDRLTQTHLAWINRISGVIITVFGLYALLGGN